MSTVNVTTRRIAALLLGIVAILALALAPAMAHPLVADDQGPRLVAHDLAGSIHSLDVEDEDLEDELDEDADEDLDEDDDD